MIFYFFWAFLSFFLFFSRFACRQSPVYALRISTTYRSISNPVAPARRLARSSICDLRRGAPQLETRVCKVCGLEQNHGITGRRKSLAECHQPHCLRREERDRIQSKLSELNPKPRRISIGACTAEEAKKAGDIEVSGKWCVDGKKKVCGANDDMRGPREQCAPPGWEATLFCEQVF